MTSRIDRLAPMNTELGRRLPKWVRCYDNGGETCDRYTVVYSQQKDGVCRGISMSARPFHPQGVGQHFEYDKADLWRMGQQWGIDRPKYSHLGKKIKFTDLPTDCQRAVLQDYAELWDLPLSELTAGMPPASVSVAA